MSPLPAYCKRPIGHGKNFFLVEKTLKAMGLETVCQEALCPNLGECWSQKTATFLILGKQCTRNCRFCSVQKGRPLPPDPAEPKKIAEAVVQLGLKYSVITSVTRDDLADGGASHFARVIREIRWESPETKVEVLIPDFRGDIKALKIVIDARPDVLAHNLETVPRLYAKVRPQAKYLRSLTVLRMSKTINPKMPTKSGLMLGLGETKEEILKVLRDLRRVDCDFVTMGQYLAPSEKHLKVKRYLAAEEYEEFRRMAIGLGFKGVASAPLARSSYRAHELLNQRAAA